MHRADVEVGESLPKGIQSGVAPNMNSRGGCEVVKRIEDTPVRMANQAVDANVDALSCAGLERKVVPVSDGTARDAERRSEAEGKVRVIRGKLLESEMVSLLEGVVRLVLI